METTNHMDHTHPIEDNSSNSTTGVRGMIERLRALGNRPVPETLLSRVVSDLKLRTEYERPRDLNHDLIRAYCNKGDYFCLLERYEEALAAYEEALHLDPENALIAYGKGRILCELERYEEALTAYEEALRLDATLITAYTEKGHVLCTLQRYEEALAAYEEALRLAPNDSAALRNKGNSFYNMERYEEALTVYEEALQLDPENASTWRDKCVTLVALDNFAEALMAYQQVQRLDPATVLGQEVVEVLKSYNDADGTIGQQGPNLERQARSIMWLSGQMAPKFTESRSIEQIPSNSALMLHWPTENSQKQAVCGLKVEEACIKKDTPLQRVIAVELEDLLCRLFHHASSITIRPLSSGFSEARILHVTPCYGNKGVGYPVVVKYGDIHLIEQEYYNYKEYVEAFLGDGRSATIRATNRTKHLGGIIYSLLGSSQDRLEDFGTFYHHASVSRVKKVLDHLFLNTCGRWYANHGPLQSLDLATSYQQQFSYTAQELEQVRIDSLPGVQGKERLYFQTLPQAQSFLNPILATADQKFTRSTYTCTTHGDLNAHNILIDTDGYTWLIDFQSTGPSHILRDIATLDAVLRFQLLADATLEERLQMEKALMSSNEYGNQRKYLKISYFTTNEQVQKTYQIIMHLRTMAQTWIKQNPGGDLSEYHIALLYNALDNMRFKGLFAVQREHALISASLLTDQLELGP